LPLSIHLRDAYDDAVSILREERADEIGGVIHCFSGDRRVARQMLDLDFDLSFSGVITFKNAEELRSVAREVPADRFLIETDAPYLAPVPQRGKRNEPQYVLFTAACIAEQRGQPIDEICSLTPPTRNAASVSASVPRLLDADAASPCFLQPFVDQGDECGGLRDAESAGDGVYLGERVGGHLDVHQVRSHLWRTDQRRNVELRCRYLGSSARRLLHTNFGSIANIGEQLRFRRAASSGNVLCEVATVRRESNAQHPPPDDYSPSRCGPQVA
jgi:hypothetical protein